jgi:hypothetical protein
LYFPPTLRAQCDEHATRFDLFRAALRRAFALRGVQVLAPSSTCIFCNFLSLSLSLYESSYAFHAQRVPPRLQSLIDTTVSSSEPLARFELIGAGAVDDADVARAVCDALVAAAQYMPSQVIYCCFDRCRFVFHFISFTKFSRSHSLTHSLTHYDVE